MIGIPMRQLLVMTLLGVLLAGCTCDECDPRSGSYEASYVETSGNCGPIANQVIVPGGAPSNCSGDVRTSADNCSVTISNQQCLFDDGTYTIAQGSAEWSCDGEEGEAVLSIVLADDFGTLCSSSYDVLYEKL